MSEAMSDKKHRKASSSTDTGIALIGCLLLVIILIAAPLLIVFIAYMLVPVIIPLVIILVVVFIIYLVSKKKKIKNYACSSCGFEWTAGDITTYLMGSR